MGSDGWLPLLQWDAQRASRIAEKVEGLNLEPHPVSGELELQDVNTIQYRRLDAETLQARLDVEEFELLPVYVWCDSDDEGGGSGWKLAELRAMEDGEDGTQWFHTTSEATQEFEKQRPAQRSASNGHLGVPQAREEDDDDDYWASYDRTPSQTPAHPSPAPPQPSSMPRANPQNPSSAEQEYYARYGTEVQPALDSHDPDEEHAETGTSTLNGDSLLGSSNGRPESRPTGRSLYAADPHDSATTSISVLNTSLKPTVESPRPRSPSSSASSRSVERLEQKAATMTSAEVGVKQFVSTEVKSLFRLARSVGIDRQEFERMVRTELDVLTLLERDD